MGSHFVVFLYVRSRGLRRPVGWPGSFGPFACRANFYPVLQASEISCLCGDHKCSPTEESEKRANVSSLSIDDVSEDGEARDLRGRPHSSTQSSQHPPSSAWLRPCVRPRWLSVDPHRSQISGEFVSWCEQRGTEVVDTAGKAKEPSARRRCSSSCSEVSWLT